MRAANLKSLFRFIRQQDTAVLSVSQDVVNKATEKQRTRMGFNTWRAGGLGGIHDLYLRDAELMKTPHTPEGRAELMAFESKL